MMHTDAEFSRRVEEMVGRIEKRTDAEVVVVAAPRSGNYGDITRLAASLLAFAVLLVLLAVPWSMSELFIAMDLLVVWFVGSWFFDGTAFLRLVAPAHRQQQHVDDAAAMEFHREAVHATPNRTGLLVYVSALEGRVALLPDVGLEAHIPRGEWAAAHQEFRHDDLEHFLSGLDKVGNLLAERIPHNEDSDATNLPDAPRIRA